LLIPGAAKIPTQIIPIAYTLMTYYLVKHFQGRQIIAHTNAGGQFYNWGRTIVIGLIGLAITLVIVIGVIYFSALAGFNLV